MATISKRSGKKLPNPKARKRAERSSIRSRPLKHPSQRELEHARKITTRISCTNIKSPAASETSLRAPRIWTLIQERWRRCWNRFMARKAQSRHPRWADDDTIIIMRQQTRLPMDISTSFTTVICLIIITQCHVNQVSHHDSQDHGKSWIYIFCSALMIIHMPTIP